MLTESGLGGLVLVLPGALGSLFWDGFWTSGHAVLRISDLRHPRGGRHSLHTPAGLSSFLEWWENS